MLTQESSVTARALAGSPTGMWWQPGTGPGTLYASVGSVNWINGRSLILRVLMTGGSLLALAACQKSAPPEEKMGFVEAGNPLSFVSGTQANTRIQLGETDFTEYRFARLYSHHIASRVRQASTQAFIDSQRPGRNKVRHQGATRTNPIVSIEKHEHRLAFDDNSGIFLEPSPDTGYLVKSLNSHSKILHFSALPTGQFFSILTHEETAEGSALIASYYAREDIWHVFIKRENPRGEDLSRVTEGGVEYFFLLEYGLRWAQSLLKLNVHSTASSIDVAQTRHAARLWNQGLSEFSNLQIDVNRKNCPPFNDLETQCLYMIDGYVKSPSVAETLVVGGHDKSLQRRFVDGDIFVFRGDLEQARGAVDEAALIQATYVHELGHLLGLGHPYDLENPKHRTIMGYKIRDKSGLIDEPTAYDFKALRLLYGLPEGSKKSVN